MQGLNASPVPVSHSPAIQRAVLHPGEGAQRLAREKYGAAFEELRMLASAVNDVIENARRDESRTDAGGRQLAGVR